METINVVVRIGEQELWRNYVNDADGEDVAEGVKEMLDTLQNEEEINF